MKKSDNILGFIVLVIALLIFALGALWGNIPEEQQKLKERVEAVYQLGPIAIVCIDGYKWIMTAYDIRQAFVEKDGVSVPEKCR